MIWNFVLRNMSAGNRCINHRRRRGARRRIFDALLLTISAAVLTAGCTGTGRTGAGEDPSVSTESSGSMSKDGRISVVTTIFPPYDFVREIAGDEVNLTMLLKPGEETHSYEPTPQDIIDIQNSDVFIYTGGENDVWVEDILSSMPESDMLTLRLTDCVDTVEEEEVEGMKGSGGHSHAHETEDPQEEEESAHEIDEHVWTSPVNASLIVEHIKDVLSQADPSGSELYAENALAYQEKLVDLDRQFRNIADNAKRDVMIFGDRFPFRYFADEYGLEYYAAFPGCASDTEPSAKTVAFLIDKVKEEQIPVVFHTELSNQQMADTICEDTGAVKREFHACHNVTKEQFEQGLGYLDFMWSNVEVLKEALN